VHTDDEHVVSMHKRLGVEGTFDGSLVALLVHVPVPGFGGTAQWSVTLT